MINPSAFKNFSTPAVSRLLLLNVIIFILCNLPWKGAPLLMGMGSIYSLQSDFFYPWQFVTYMFLHADLMHIFGNMLALYMFGAWLERVWGSKRFLIFYFVTGIGACVLYWGVNTYQIARLEQEVQAYTQNPSPELAIKFFRDHEGSYYDKIKDDLRLYSDNPQEQSYVSGVTDLMVAITRSHANVPMVGASGAVFAILMAFAMLFPNTELMLLFPPIPIKAKYFVLGYGALELYMQIKNAPDDNVAHFAHLSGMLFGFILVKYWNKHRNSFY